MKSKIVEVSILDSGGMSGIPVPFDPKDIFGKVRAPVKVTVNGYTFRSTIARMRGVTFIPLRKSHREAAAVQGGEVVKVKIEADVDERVVEVPADLTRALKEKPGLWKLWTQLSFTNQRECVESILGAKRPETRERRVTRVIDRVASSAKPGATRSRRSRSIREAE